jgi:uncharacterized circularly permuted ATP-grasp superfamily protein
MTKQKNNTTDTDGAIFIVLTKIHGGRKLVLAFLASFLFFSATAFADGCEFDLLNKTSFSAALRAGEHPAFAKIQEILEGRSVETQARIDAAISKYHAEREMTFQTKDPTSGLNEKYVTVPVTGSIAPLKERDFDRMVHSTQDVMTVLRKLIQNIYSQSEITAETLGIVGKLPAEEANQLINAIRSSIYLEPKLINPVMKDYPAVLGVGFDGAIVDPISPHTVFFEFNSGTPSGQSNNAMLIEALQKFDPELFGVIRPYLVADHSYEVRRLAAESNASNWTGRAGLVVTVSPGVFNGAHPDVAMIAKGTGMPLVRPSDLYEDENGDIRLNIGQKDKNPLVTGIDNRNEESFLLQSNEDGIPMIGPNYVEINAQLSEKFGLKLRPGAIYQYKRNDKDEITDVVRDTQGNPVFQRVYFEDAIGADPNRPEAPRGSFLKALHRKKLWVSNIGGRIVDHKSLFRIITEYLVPNPNAKDLARPVKSLRISDYPKLAAEPELFVVKPPDNSGGEGISFLIAKSEAERKKIVDDVLAHPGQSEVQYLGNIVTTPRIVRNSETNVLERHDVALDWRVFVFMDGEGKVHAGPNSTLVRVAGKQSLLSNTSKGGGYGIGVVLSDRPVNPHPGVNPPPTTSSVMTFNTAVADEKVASLLHKMLDMFNDFGDLRLNDTALLSSLKHDAFKVSFLLRTFVDRLDSQSLRFIGRLRDFAQTGEVSTFEIEKGLLVVFEQLKNAQWRQDGAAEKFFKERWTELPRIGGDPVSEAQDNMPTRANLRRIDPLDKPYLIDDGPEKLVQQVELAEYISVDEPRIQEIIDDVRSQGGQVRLVKQKTVYKQGPGSHEPVYSYHSAYFWTRYKTKDDPSHLIPIIAVDLTMPAALPSLEHEYQHFKTWMPIYKSYLAQGKTYIEAVEAANQDVLEIDVRVRDEEACVYAEMQSQINNPNNPYNRKTAWARPVNYFEEAYVNRITYPQMVGVRAAYVQDNENIAEGKPHNLKELQVATASMEKSIALALETRTRAIEHWQESSLPEAKKRLEYWKSSDIFSLLTEPVGLALLNKKQVITQYTQLFKRVAEKMKIPPELQFGHASRAKGSHRLDDPEFVQQQQ